MNPYDRVRETTSTTGTSNPFVLDGADTSDFRAFSSVLSDGEQCEYVCARAGSGEWEVGIGRYDSGADTLIRVRCLSSSNSGNFVNFTAGVKKIWIDHTAHHDRAMLGRVAVISSGVWLR